FDIRASFVIWHSSFVICNPVSIMGKLSTSNRSMPSMYDTKPDPAKCLARSVAEVLAENPALEAITIDRARQTISVATIGRADVPKLTEQISATVRRAQEAAVGDPCSLLAGKGDCNTCSQPLSDLEKKRISIQ